MQRYEITAPDGKRYEITAPEGATEQQALEYAKTQFAPKKEKSIGDVLPNIGAGEGVLGLLSGALASPLAGIAGGAAALTPGLRPGIGADVVNKVTDTLTYQPRSEVGKKVVEYAAAPFEWLANKADTVGGNVTDSTGSPLLGTGANTAIQAIPMAVGGVASRLVNRPAAVAARAKAESLNAPIDAGVQAARDSGLVMTPSQMGAGLPPRIVEGLAGEPKLAKLASQKNAPTFNDLIRRDVGLPEDMPISRQSLADIRKTEGKAYEAVKSSGAIASDARYKLDLDRIVSSYDQAAKDFAHRSENPFKKVVEGLRKDRFDARSAVEEVKLLRDDADVAYAKGEKSLGKAYKDAAQALDDQILRHLEASGQARTHADYISARQRIAKTYAADAALNNTTGNIDAAVYARALKRGAPLSGPAKQVASFAQQFPRSAQRVEKIGSTGPTVFDLVTAAISKEALMAGARPLSRQALLSGPAQAVMAKKSYGPGIAQYGNEMGLAALLAEQRADTP